MLDRYWQGRASRISPEAPVPVVDVASVDERPGGAANVALNVAALGASCTLVGVIGKDEAGRQLKSKLEAAGIVCNFVELAHWPTPVKLRVVSEHQQLIRLDFEEALPSDALTQVQVLLESSLHKTDCLIIEDYDKGVITVPEEMIESAHSHKIPVVVDPKHKALERYKGATLIKPNLAEFQAAVGEYRDYKSMQAAAERVILDCQLQALLITRGSEGMLLVEREGKHLTLPSRVVDVHDVTGAGDTVAAVLGVMMALGEDFDTSVMIANVAASIVVAKSGTALATAPEIQRELIEGLHVDRGVMDHEALKEQVSVARSQGEKIVFTNGCFDILHAGHITYLEEARRLGDRLIVAVNSDSSVTALKGEGRPVNNINARMRVLSGLTAVDWVVPFAEETPETLLRALQPDLLVKGGDYGISGVVGADIVLGYGGEVKVLSLVEGVSTTHILEKVRR